MTRDNIRNSIGAAIDRYVESAGKVTIDEAIDLIEKATGVPQEDDVEIVKVYPLSKLLADVGTDEADEFCTRLSKRFGWGDANTAKTLVRLSSFQSGVADHIEPRDGDGPYNSVWRKLYTLGATYGLDIYIDLEN